MSIKGNTRVQYNTKVNRSLRKLRTDWLDANSRFNKSLADKRRLHRFIYFAYVEQGYSQPFLADMLGVTRQAINNIVTSFSKGVKNV